MGVIIVTRKATRITCSLFVEFVILFTREAFVVIVVTRKLTGRTVAGRTSMDVYSSLCIQISILRKSVPMGK